MKYMVEKITLVLGIFYSFLLGMVVITSNWALTNFMPEYMEAVHVLNFLIIAYYFMNIGTAYGLTMTSTMVNRLYTSVIISTVGIIINVAVSIYLVKVGFGIIDIAIGTVTSKIITMMIGFVVVLPYIFANKLEAITHIFKTNISFIVTLLFLYITIMIGIYNSTDFQIVISQVFILSILQVPFIIYLQRKTGLFGMIKNMISKIFV